MAVSTLVFLVIVLSMLILPAAYSQDVRQESCSDGKVWVADDAIHVQITGNCPVVAIAGSGNTIMASEIGELSLMGSANTVTADSVVSVKAGGDGNTVNYRAGPEAEVWFGGEGNRLIALDGSVDTEENVQPLSGSRSTTAAEATNQSSALQPSNSSIVQYASAGNVAPLLIAMPGPHVPINGQSLGRLPAGYSMHIQATHFWTSDDLTQTSQTRLSLTNDGQFEKRRFAVYGSAFDSSGTIISSDKTGSVGAVHGSTSLGGTGANSVYLKERKGLDPAKYGTYYISGNKIELLHADGRKDTHTFETDGYRLLSLDDKKYFAQTPVGWQKLRMEGHIKYRSLDGAYTATVWKTPASVSDGVKWLNSYLERGKKKGIMATTGPVSTLRASNYKLAKSVVTFVNNSIPPRDVYFRYGGYSVTGSIIQVESFATSGDDKKLLKFFEDVD